MHAPSSWLSVINKSLFGVGPVMPSIPGFMCSTYVCTVVCICRLLHRNLLYWNYVPVMPTTLNHWYYTVYRVVPMLHVLFQLRSHVGFCNSMADPVPCLQLLLCSCWSSTSYRNVAELTCARLSCMRTRSSGCNAMTMRNYVDVLGSRFALCISTTVRCVRGRVVCCTRA